MRRRGFTLIELLVVIGIIAVLAAIILPIYRKAQEKSHAARCLSNLKALGVGFKMYCQDWNDKLPASAKHISAEFRPTAPGGPPVSWVGIVWTDEEVEEETLPSGWSGSWFYRIRPEAGGLMTGGYITSKKVFICPEERDDARYPLSYSMNEKLDRYNTAFIKDPSSCILLVHEASTTIDDGNFSPTSNWMTNIHSEAGYALCVGGNVERLKFQGGSFPGFDADKCDPSHRE